MSQLGPEIRKIIQEYKEHSLAQIDRAVEETTKDSKDIVKAKANVDIETRVEKASIKGL